MILDLDEESWADVLLETFAHVCNASRATERRSLSDGALMCRKEYFVCAGYPGHNNPEPSQ